MTSVVSLVIRLDVEYLSMFEKEKFWIFSNIAFLRFLAKPVDAFAPYFAPIIPAHNPISAAISI